MNVKLKRVAPVQAGKMLAALYGSLALLIMPFFVFTFGMAGLAAGASGSRPAVPVVLGLGVGMIFLLPLLYAAMGFVFGALGALIYNLFAGWLGGFAFEFEQLPPPPLRSP